MRAPTVEDSDFTLCVGNEENVLRQLPGGIARSYRHRSAVLFGLALLLRRRFHFDAV